MNAQVVLFRHVFTGFDNGAASFNRMAFNYHEKGGLANTGQDLFRHKCSLDAYTFVLCTTQLDSWIYKPKMWYVHLANLQFIVFFVTLNIIILRITKTRRDEESVCSALKCSILAVKLHFWSKMTHKDTAPCLFFNQHSVCPWGSETGRRDPW